MDEKDLILKTELLAKYPYIIERNGSADHAAFDVPADKVLEFAKAIHDIEGFTSIQDCAGCDWGIDAERRFSAMYHFYNHDKAVYLRVNVYAENNENPIVPSLCSIWPGCNWHEREAYDLIGIIFKDHPDMRRILMWDAYPYHPLRKDFPLAGIPVPFPDSDTVAQTGVEVIAAPQNGGPFLADVGKTLFESEPDAKNQSWAEKSELKNLKKVDDGK